MRISAKGEYAIRALLDLAVHHGEGRLVPIQEVARRQGIPQRYLEQVLLLLKRAGLLESKRGSAGGYQLVRPPVAISVGEVLRAVEGRVTALEVAGRHPGRAGEAAAADLAPLWREIAGAVAAVIDLTTFGDLAEQVKARRSPERAIYHI
jgi:Rrf2 family protein